jgi:uncharacterized membrane protein YphA (DoxX/SURF4 family)
MKPNPISHVIEFLTQPAWTTGIYWLLLLGSVGIALYVFATIPSQRTGRHVGDWLCRFIIGTMWWQQTLWKLPPYYTDQPDHPMTSGLAYWLTEMGKSAWIPLQADFVNSVVIPHFYVFAPIVYSLEVLTAVSLILGIFVRFWGVIGAFQILNLWLGLYDEPGEWPWTYFFLLVLQIVFALRQYGRSLGLDAVIVERCTAAKHPSLVARVALGALT